MYLHGYDTFESVGPGRLSSRVVDGTPLLADPAFLAAEAPCDGRWTDEICAVFGVTCDDLRTLRRRHLTDPDTLPVFTVPLAAGGTVLIIQCIDDVWVCHVRHSRRNPVGGDALRPDELRRCSELLAPAG